MGILPRLRYWGKAMVFLSLTRLMDITDDDNRRTEATALHASGYNLLDDEMYFRAWLSLHDLPQGGQSWTYSPKRWESNT
ncbi:MAG: hypothetical protein VYE00_10585 [Candidatus Poribacteria bacterium]|nr:hypothetical protein [Candidatus Poribacteria bacterium]